MSEATTTDASNLAPERTTMTDNPVGPMTLYVCTTCRVPEAPLGDSRPGARLHEALAVVADDPLVRIEPVECLSVCKRVCTIAFAAPGKWTYVYGDLPAETAAATILEGAALYARAKHGIIPWKIRPDALKKGVVSRTPPMPGLGA